MTDYGVAFTTQDGRVWFSDGAASEQVGSTSPDVLERWGFTQDGYAFKEAELGGGRLDRRLRGVVRVPDAGRDRDRRLRHA